MQVVRVIVWVLLVVVLALYAYHNWYPVSVRIWPDLVWDTKVSVVMGISFFVGLVPMWLYARGLKWQLRRRIHSLENAARTAAVPASVVAETPLAVDTEILPDALPEQRKPLA